MTSETTSFKIGVLGCGNVGAALVELVRSQRATVLARTGLDLEVTRVAVRNMSAPREVELDEGVLTRDALAVVSDPEVDIVVESIGGIEPARELILAALEHGKPLITGRMGQRTAGGCETEGGGLHRFHHAQEV